MAAVEFALALPIIFLMMFALADVVQFGRGHLRAQSAATQIGQIISQCAQFHTNDEAVLMELAGRILGSFAENGARYALRITAFGRDGSGTSGNNFVWSVSKDAGTARPGEPALAVVSKGTALPSGDQGSYQMGKDRMLFRTEVFVSLDRTPLTRMVSMLQGNVSVGDKVLSSKVSPSFDTASGEAVFSTRMPNTDPLRAKKTGGEQGCFM